MFEVQLGAAMLLQFEQDGDTVRVLADAGVKASGYAATHVRDKVKPILGGDAHIDLIIGTHYDEDHLSGLVPIIADPTISIGEAWMPPIVNDTQIFPIDQPLTASNLLTMQLAGEQRCDILDAYLAAKRTDIEMIAAIERELDPEFQFKERSDDQFLATRRENGANLVDHNPDDLAFFRAQFGADDKDACTIDHGSEQEIEAHPLVATMVDDAMQSRFFYYPFGVQPYLDRIKGLAEEARTDAAYLIKPRMLSLANLRKSAAKDAINAKSLHDVLDALAKRKIPVRSEIIEDGAPKRYRWTPASRRFVLARPDSQGLTFTLLGPSRTLVNKHRVKLPVLEAARIALAFTGEIRSITASNQLSYIGCFNYCDQAILVSGDAGCVDFRPVGGKYFPDLLKAMQPLHIVQVAHHGGNNAHFYRVLAAAGYPEQEEQSYMLLSHATHDKTRPSEVFHNFLLTTLREADDIRLLFTSQPTRDRVVDFLGAIHPVVGPSGTKGDIRLEFEDHWQVVAHAVAAPAA
jgi:hypothetical protein